MTSISKDTDHSGFTLIELIVTLAVFAIILLIAVPSYRDLILNNRGVSQINDLVAGLNYARSEAIKRGISVSVCASSDGATCNAGSDWSQGWIIGVLPSTALPALNPILKIYPPLSGNAQLASESDIEVRFDRNGFATGFNNSFLLCPEDDDPRKIRAAMVALSGRISLAEDTNNNGILELTPGTDLSCTASS